MADAWGGSWGTSWANSWNGGSAPTVVTNSAPMRAYHAEQAQKARYAEVERKRQLQLYRIRVAELQQQERELERQRQEALEAEQAKQAERVAKPSGKVAKTQRNAEDKAAKVVRYLTGELANAKHALAIALGDLARLENEQLASAESLRIDALNLDDEIVLILAASL